MEPRSEKLVPGGPEFVRVTLVGASTTRVRRWPWSLRLLRVTLGAVMCTTLFLLALTLYCATLVTPEQVTLALVQVKVPVREMPTVAPVQVPGPSTTDPRSRSCSQVKISGFTTLALTAATPSAAACAGEAPIRPLASPRL